MKRFIFALTLCPFFTLLPCHAVEVEDTIDSEYASDDCLPNIEMKKSKKKKKPTSPAPQFPAYAYGSFSFNGALAVNIGASDEVPFSPVKIGSQATGSGVTSDGNGTITVARAGTYLISFSLEAGSGAGPWSATLLLNNNNGENSLVASAVGGNHTVSSQSVFSLGSNSTLSISISNPADSNSILTITKGTINVVQIAQ